ncbi:unnamed protein product [Amoebophrya sp. A120]|nr:unnamed protein product [Amoebophrya sp. A120]|eukprot:GSA120T00025187001.1
MTAPPLWTNFVARLREKRRTYAGGAPLDPSVLEQGKLMRSVLARGKSVKHTMLKFGTAFQQSTWTSWKQKPTASSSSTKLIY